MVALVTQFLARDVGKMPKILSDFWKWQTNYSTVEPYLVMDVSIFIHIPLIHDRWRKSKPQFLGEYNAKTSECATYPSVN